MTDPAGNPRVVGIGTTRFGRRETETSSALVREALSDALGDAGIDPSRVGMVVCANATAGLIEGQEMIRGQVALGETGLLGRPVLNVENACASGASAFHVATAAVQSGQVDLAVAVGSERLSHPERWRSGAALATAIDVRATEELRDRYDATDPAASLFMAIYADMATSYMGRTGATAEDFALVAAKNRTNAVSNPNAHFGSSVDADAVRASRMIHDPLNLMMCSGISDGAAALVIASPSVAASLRPDGIRVRGSVLRSGSPDDPTSPITHAARAVYEASGIDPAEIGLVELHDASAPAELIHYEELELAGEGEAARDLRDGTTARGGARPVNPSGGLLGRGHPVGATGVAQVVELVRRLREDVAAGRKRVALAENSGGFLAPHPAAAVVSLLSTD